MPNNENLTPKEQQNLDEELRITSREAEIMDRMTVMPGTPPGLSDLFMQNIMKFEEKMATQPATTVGEQLAEHNFLDVDKLTEEEAERAIIDLLTALARNNVRIDTPEMVSAKEFYRWLCEDFVKQEVNMPLGDGWNTNFIYTELVPEGPDAMNFMVKTCLEDLFRLDSQSNPWTFDDQLITEEEGDGPAQIHPALTRYITAWREAILTVADYEYTPLKGVQISENLADFTFSISYALVREDGSRDEFGGNGQARLAYDGCYWSIRTICFPGFKLPELP